VIRILFFVMGGSISRVIYCVKVLEGGLTLPDKFYYCARARAPTPMAGR
jgi:hypothetical protein